MSHFNVLVIGPKNEEGLAKALQPFHEFECTGINDQYVQDIDRTEKARAEYEASDKTETFAQYTCESYGWPIVLEGQPLDTDGEHKYGYILLDQSGEVVKCGQRTNPNRKWDYWVVGGRWSGMLIPVAGGLPVIGERKADGTCDSLRVRDIDVQALRERRRKDAAEDFSKWYHAQIGLPLARTLEDLTTEHGEDTARGIWLDQPRVKALRRIGYLEQTIDLYPCVPGVDSEERIQQVRFEAGRLAADRCLRTFLSLIHI